MGLDTRRPPLPAPTESTDETSGPDTEVGTTLTTRTDKTSYSIPEDGSPITISTHKINAGREGGLHHRRQKSQTSLLIEYFETSKSGDKSKNRPSVRVKVTPSGTKKHPAARGAVQITGIGSDRKPSYTRRISLRNTSAEQDTSPDEDADLGYSPQATSSRRAPVEIEVLQDGSEISTAQSSRGLLYAPIDSNISSMPPDSMLDGNYQTASDVSQFPDNDDESTVRDADFLNAPLRDRSRSVSRERLTQKVMEKLNASSSEQKASPSSREKGTKDYEYNSPRRERRTRARKDSRPDDDVFSGAESSLLSSSKSYRSGSSQASRVTNNPKLLEMVEDTIKRVILPEINALKADQKVQKTERNLQSFDEHRRVHSKSSDYETSDLQRQVSKSSSSPNIASRPKVVLNREGDDPGTVLSRGDSERKKVRRPHRDERSEHRSSSRRSSGKHSRRSSYDTEERSVRRVSRDENEGGKAVAAAIAGGGLTAAALKHHDSQTDMHERRKMRSKSRGSRSRSASLAEPVEEPPARKGVIPPLPLASRINDSEVTRDSILSGGSDRAHLRNSGEAPAIMREVSRGSLRDAITPGSIRTPTRTSVTRTLEKDYFTRDSASPGSPAGSHGKARSKSRTAALAKTVEERHMDADGYGSPTSPRKLASPAQSVSSLKKHFEDEPLVPQSLKLRGASSRSGGRLHDLKASQSDFRSDESLPTAKLASSRQQSRDASGDEFITPLEHSFADNEPESVHTPGEETANAWFDRQRAVNDRYRDSMGESNRDSYQTNPYPQDERSFSYADDARRKQLDDDDNEEYADENAVHSVQVKHGLDHRFVPSPVDVESAVASLLDPSTVDSNRVSTSDSPALQNGSYSNRMAEQLRALGKDSPGIYEGSTISQTIPSQDRWAALRGKATGLADVAEHGSATHSPAQSPAKEFRESFEEQPKMHASGLPLADDPMPEIGHYDSQSDLTTNPSIIQGPLGGDPTGKESWPYTPEADRAGDLKHNHSEQSMRGTAITGAALAGAGVALVGASSAGAGRQVMEEDEPQRSTPDLGRNRTAALKRDVQPSRSPTALRNDNYARDTQDLPRDVLTPSGEPMYKKEDLEEYEAAMNAHDGESISTSQAPRHYRANSHGMASPLYDSATGNGIDRIQSKDIVALMDHLTVRDAQRNARDTEMLVALVRSAAEMRQSFDEMKRFIAEQDKLIMRQAGRVGEQTAQKVLSGPRPQPTASPRTPQRTLQEDTQTKRKGVLRRALQGLTGGKGPKDLAKIEDMLMQILDNVEDLKHQGGPRPSGASFDNASLDSYERSRAAGEPGYEQADDRSGSSSTPTQSGHFPVPSGGKQQFHSGYDGRRGSTTRVSTVVEDDEDELEPHEEHVLGHQFENNERMLTPTQELQNMRDLGPDAKSSQQAANLPTPDKQRKHKSNGSSIFGIPKISRWSKTTASSAAPDLSALDSPNAGSAPAYDYKSVSEASRSGSALENYDEGQYRLQDDDRIRSTQSLAREQNRANARGETRSVRSRSSKHTRTPSPLIPSEASSKARDEYDDDNDEYEDDEDDIAFDDPKYQAHRNSLLLEHPQPRAGPTPRHQNTLESQAHTFDDMTGTNSDVSQRTVSDFDPAVWGSSGTAGLARHKLANFEPISPVSMNSPNYARNSKDDGPLVPSQKAPVQPKVYHEPEPEPDWEPQYSNSGFSKGGYYSSPYGSGHLLEPIEEVRYSLETDRSSHVSLSREPEHCDRS
jgi:hypothetical protein